MHIAATPLCSGDRPTAASRRRNRHRPTLERCEGRTLLTTYAVTALTDAGTGHGTSGDLRYCIRRANSDGRQDTITFSVTGTIQLESALPTLVNGRGITIAGPGAGSLTVRGGGPSSNFSILKIKDKAVATIAGLTIADGHARQSGGGVFNGGKLTVTGVTFTGNSAGQSGGGIYTLGPATIVDSTFTGNSATSGGGIETTYSTTKIANTSIEDNSASVFGGGISVNSRRFLHDIGGKLTLDNSTLSGNRAGRADGGGFGGGIASNVSEININGTSFTNNTSGRDAGGIGVEGGNVSVARSTFGDNTTGGSGGGLFIDSGVSINGQFVTDGASLSVARSTFVGNTAGRNGGGIDATLTAAKVTDATFTGNSAGSFGGGISVESNSPFTVTHGTLTLANATLSGNRAGRSGGGISNFDHVILTNATITGNQAANTGGGIYNAKSLIVGQSTVTENRPDNFAGIE